MSRTSWLAGIFTALLGGAIGAQAITIEAGKLPVDFDPQKVDIRPLVESVPRQGLPNFYGKLATGGEVTIAYFGGSITAQAGYRIHSREYFQKEYPNCQVKEIHAAIGGTGSNLGALRLEHDVLRHNPDLVMVEFAVNDSGAHPYSIRKSMEGIVRHIWRELPATGILFVYTLTAAHVKEMQDGKMQRSASVMEDIADYYGIPSIHMGVEIVKLEAAGKLVMKASDKELTRVSGDELNISADNFVNAEGKIPFAGDGVHPYANTGHQLYMDAIRRSLPAIKAAGTAGARAALPLPMVKECWENVITVPLDHPLVKITGTWEKNPGDHAVTKGFIGRMDPFFTFSPGAEIRFKFKGTTAALYNLLGPHGCIFEKSVAGGKSSEVRTFDPYCTYHRLALSTLADQMNPDAVHEVTLKVLDKDFDKRIILFDHNKGDFDKNPAKYDPKLLYAACIFIIGEICE